jgi:hypothetical protein
MKTILLLVCSNIFMTLAWYGQLRLQIFQRKALWLVVLMSWGIAFFEYCLMVPANRHGYANGMTGYQLKVIQEVITLGVFVVFAWLVLGERLTWNYAVSFALIVAAVYFATAVRPAAVPSGRPVGPSVAISPRPLMPGAGGSRATERRTTAAAGPEATGPGGHREAG